MNKHEQIASTMDSAIQRLENLLTEKTDELIVSIRGNVTIDIWRLAHIVGYNYITKRLLVSDEKGSLIYYAEIRKPDGTELSAKDYESKVRAISRIQREALNNLVNC